MLRQRAAGFVNRRRSSGHTPPDPSDCGLADHGDDSSSDEDGGGGDAAAKCEGKPWMRVDKAVYEEQLEKLQEQLVHVMLENQSLQGEQTAFMAIQ